MLVSATILAFFAVSMQPFGGQSALAGRSAGFPRFLDVADDVGLTVRNVTGDTVEDYIVEANGNGAAFLDYDDDGDVDLLIANGSTLESYSQGGDPMVVLYENTDGSFADVTSEAGLEAKGWGMGLCVADYDNDGDSDFYLTAFGPNILYGNNGDGTFSEKSRVAGVGDAGWGTNCAFADYDRDGDLDLYVANYLTFDEDEIEPDGCAYRGVEVFCGPVGLPAEPDLLYRNNGDRTFTNVAEEAGIAESYFYGFGVVFSDFDGDLWPDIYVANDSVPNFLFHNRGDGTFSEIGLLSGTALNGIGRAQAGMGVGVDDYDGDGRFDIFVTNFSGDTNTLYRNNGDMFFEDVTIRAGLADASFPHVGWGTGFADLDNDGFKDLFVANGQVDSGVEGRLEGESYHQRREVYRNMGNGTFAEIAAELGDDLVELKSARGAAFGDIDNDGDIDIVVININDRPSFYLNEAGSENHWITLRLEGTISNRNGIGARIELEAGGRLQTGEVRSGGSYLSHNDMRIHFGLGYTSRIDRIRIRWPSGTVEELDGFEANQFLKIREGQGIVESSPSTR